MMNCYKTENKDLKNFDSKGALSSGIGCLGRFWHFYNLSYRLDMFDIDFSLKLSYFKNRLDEILPIIILLL